MAFRPLPKRLALATLFILFCLGIWIAWASYRNPEALWAPGNLSRYHADIDHCLTCHNPFQGATSSQCTACHSQDQFEHLSKPAIAGFHRLKTAEGRECTQCHTEHRGALAQITFGAMIDNPHGEFVFRATGTQSCGDCHSFIDGKDKPSLLDNAVVRHLLEEGDGAHRPGKMADCLRCHRGGMVDSDDDD